METAAPSPLPVRPRWFSFSLPPPPEARMLSFLGNVSVHFVSTFLSDYTSETLLFSFAL